MKKIAIGILILVLTGCTHYYYAPNAANIPLFKEKNSFKGKAGFGGGNNYNGGDIQLAYSASPKVGVMLNSFFAGRTEQVNELGSGDSHDESGKGSFFEAGVGYYKPFGKNKIWIFETYGGAGIGTENHVYNYHETSKLHIAKYFIQPSIGYISKSGVLEIAVASRFSGLNLKINQNNVSENSGIKNVQDMDSIRFHPSSFLWEPSVMIAVGWPDFKFFLEHTTSQNWSNPYLAQDNVNFLIGIKFTLKNKTHK